MSNEKQPEAIGIVYSDHNVQIDDTYIYKLKLLYHAFIILFSRLLVPSPSSCYGL